MSRGFEHGDLLSAWAEGVAQRLAAKMRLELEREAAKPQTPESFERAMLKIQVGFEYVIIAEGQALIRAQHAAAAAQRPTEQLKAIDGIVIADKEVPLSRQQRRRLALTAAKKQ